MIRIAPEGAVDPLFGVIASRGKMSALDAAGGSQGDLAGQSNEQGFT